MYKEELTRMKYFTKTGRITVVDQNIKQRKRCIFAENGPSLKNITHRIRSEMYIYIYIK